MTTPATVTTESSSISVNVVETLSKHGGWRSASFVIGAKVAERFAFHGISSDLISYMTTQLGLSTATAAANLNLWSSASSLLPLFVAFLADSFFGHYRTIIVSSVLYILGLGLLALSALFPIECSPSPSQLQIIVFFSGLYLVALALGGHEPCIQAFGADQFDGQSDVEECKEKSSFFNWWYFSMSASVTVTYLITTYIQDNVSWALAFGIHCLVMLISLLIFLFGTFTYRFHVNTEKNTSPFVRISRVFVRAVRNWTTKSEEFSTEAESQSLLHYNDSQQCSIIEVEEAKSVLRLFPIWATCLVYGIVFQQPSTLFTKQGVTMDRTMITPSFQVPAASLRSLISLSTVLFIPIYDRVLVPIARVVTGKSSGITMLQRIGTGLFLSSFAMAIAALVEMKRLETALEYELVDRPNVTIPMSIMWLIPQYLLFGIQNVFTMVGLQEFFYDQVPNELKSIGLALCLSIFGIGSFLSSFLIYVIEKATSGEDGHESWFSNNLNKAHLDYFYWVLAGLSAAAFASYLYFARSYIYNRRSK